MRRQVLKQVDYGRVREGRWGSDPSFGLNGVFDIQGPCGLALHVVASDGTDELADGWEHVSVSTVRRAPNWLEMCFIKRLFWEEEECVVQFHPPRSDYINNHPYCLHLWRNRKLVMPTPPLVLVGMHLSG